MRMMKGSGPSQTTDTSRQAGSNSRPQNPRLPSMFNGATTGTGTWGTSARDTGPHRAPSSSTGLYPPKPSTVSGTIFFLFRDSQVTSSWIRKKSQQKTWPFKRPLSTPSAPVPSCAPPVSTSADSIAIFQVGPDKSSLHQSLPHAHPTHQQVQRTHPHQSTSQDHSSWVMRSQNFWINSIILGLSRLFTSLHLHTAPTKTLTAHRWS